MSVRVRKAINFDLAIKEAKIQRLIIGRVRKKPSRR